MNKKLFLVFQVFLLVGVVSFVSSDQQIDPNDKFIQSKMIMNLPELKGFTFGGMWQPNISIDLRYISPIDNGQHSEYYLLIYNTSEQANMDLKNILQQARYSSNVSKRLINSNQVFEVTFEREPYAREFDWVSDNYLLRGWNGNDIGSVHDDSLFYALTYAYLEKYPSTFGDGEDSINKKSCCDECVKVHSAISGRSTVNTCISLVNIDSVLPYHISNLCENFFNKENINLTIDECIMYISKDTVTPETFNESIITPPKLEVTNSNTTMSSVETPKNLSVQSSNEINYTCKGCKLNNLCYQFGFRKNKTFCSDENNQFIPQKKSDVLCENNFECSSNVCAGGKCISASLIQKILNWFKNLFG